MRTKTNNAALIMGVSVAASAAMAPNLVVPAFGDMLSAFGGELPLLTRFFVDWRGLLWLFPLAVAALGLWLPRRTWLAFGLGVGGGVLLIGLLVIAMYLPIFRIADIIG